MIIVTLERNLGEFPGWALEDVLLELATLMMDEAWIESTSRINNTPIP